MYAYPKHDPASLSPALRISPASARAIRRLFVVDPTQARDNAYSWVRLYFYSEASSSPLIVGPLFNLVSDYPSDGPKHRLCSSAVKYYPIALSFFHCLRVDAERGREGNSIHDQSYIRTISSLKQAIVFSQVDTYLNEKRSFSILRQ